MGRLGNGLHPIHIDAPVHINAPLYAPGVALNTTQFVDADARTVTSSQAVQTGYTTPLVYMRAGSKVNIYVNIPWRQNAGAGEWGGGYHILYFRVNVPVRDVPANTWILYTSSGYTMDYTSSVISHYTDSSHLPFTIDQDFTIEFQHRFRSWLNTTNIFYINSGHAIDTYVDNNLMKFGIPINTLGYSKYIITEISK